ncbi:MAG: hypothetical protein HGB17_17865 [Syntrophobacteraceae bacterium]|nr:hypothetical protein [Syntrophobacteraceae bacterium]
MDDATELSLLPGFDQLIGKTTAGYEPCPDPQSAGLKAGYTWVVDADLKAYFDSIPHGRLMGELGRYIADGRLLSLIEAFLKQDILEDLKLWTPEEGTPQGAVVSPLLANVYLHPVDTAMAGAGYEMIGYADDSAPRRRGMEAAMVT